MKVWEKCNEVKGTNATKDEIANWAYENRICPLQFMELKSVKARECAKRY